MKKILYIAILILNGLVIQAQVTIKVDGQNQEIELANEYYKQGEYEKAKELYQKIAKNREHSYLIHGNYLNCLYKLKDWDEAEKFLKKQIKNNETNISYKADFAQYLELTGKLDESKKEFESIIEFSAKSDNTIYGMQDFFYRNGKNDYVIALLKRGRELQKDDNKYAVFLARAYLIAGQKEAMLEEILKYGLVENNLDYVRASIQDNFREEKELDLLEKTLYKKVQQFPNEQYYSDMLVWHLIQQKEFYKAFVQARALDRRYKLEGQKVYEIAWMTYQNKDFRNASIMYEYVMKEYPQGQYYPYARRLLIQCREEIVKTTYPVNKTDIRGLIGEYQKMFLEIGQNSKTMEAMRNTAQLYAFYLNERDTANIVLEKAIMIAGNDNEFKDKCKLDMGDIYILKNEPWEATLLYSQVEKSQKEELLGQDAKLRNGKLHYYNGEFDLSKEVLDILKKATTREIANDAMKLSLLIEDNTGLDSTETAMREYAAVDLLLFQNKNFEAIDALETLYGKYKSHSLADEILWLRANTYLKVNEPQKAMTDLELLEKNYKEDILADDAIFSMAKIYEEKLDQKSKAMELYREILQKHPNSIYAAESRKRFRILRGDTIN